MGAEVVGIAPAQLPASSSQFRDKLGTGRQQEDFLTTEEMKKD
jgi:hypothetical protein